MIDIGFIGLGTMGRPMAGHLRLPAIACSCTMSRRLHRSWSKPAAWSANRARKSQLKPMS